MDACVLAMYIHVPTRGPCWIRTLQLLFGTDHMTILVRWLGAPLPTRIQRFVRSETNPQRHIALQARSYTHLNIYDPCLLYVTTGC